MKTIRNFCIVAHIDHGKSTLADRLLEYTNTVAGKDMQAQVLDDMDLERERGITIKSHAIQMDYLKDGSKYTLNLIDTPGHVDFSYEVSRSIAACEGALLVVDATQGVQAQTISNLYMAIDNGLEIIPVINKIDMDSAHPDEVEDEIVELLGCEPSDIIRCSARTGEGVPAILDAIVDRVPAPKGDPEAPLQALIFDSVFNSFRGIIVYFKILNGSIAKGDFVKFVNTQKEYNVDELGVLKLRQQPCDRLSTSSADPFSATSTVLISSTNVTKCGFPIDTNTPSGKGAISGRNRLLFSSMGASISTLTLATSPLRPMVRCNVLIPEAVCSLIVVLSVIPHS